MDRIRALPSLGAVYSHRNLSFIGPPGTGNRRHGKSLRADAGPGRPAAGMHGSLGFCRTCSEGDGHPGLRHLRVGGIRGLCGVPQKMGSTVGNAKKTGAERPLKTFPPRAAFMHQRLSPRAPISSSNPTVPPRPRRPGGRIRPCPGPGARFPATAVRAGSPDSCPA